MNPADELLELTRQVRAQLGRHIAAGAWAAPGGATARSVIVPFDTPVGDSVVEEYADAPATGRRSLAQIREDVGECTRCKLSATRKSIVFGVGDPNAPLMFVGEGPGEQEDKRGEPFVGPAGELLDKMIEAMGWSRRSVYINNIIQCRPPGNRNPEPDEVAACKPFLDARIGSIAPRIIVALGRPAANTLLGRDAPISSLRGKFHDRNGVRVMPTFHPAYLLREPDRKRDTWADLKLVMAELQRLGITAPGTPRG
ncbi:MAG: uracil-DNA glycosylase [Deltaproteobacteria bacterium]